MLVTNEATVWNTSEGFTGPIPSGLSGRRCWNDSTSQATANIAALKARRDRQYDIHPPERLAAFPRTAETRPSAARDSMAQNNQRPTGQDRAPTRIVNERDSSSAFIGVC